MTDDGLGFRYFFVGPDGASGFRDLAHAEEDSPEADFDPGFAVAVVEQRTLYGKEWGRTRHGLWVDLHELNAAHPIPLHGSVLAPDVASKAPDVAWVLVDHATTYTDAAATKHVGVRLRFDVVHWAEVSPNGKTVRVTGDGVEPAEWMRASDLAHPTAATPPAEVGGEAATERWIDVDLSTQTLLAYDGPHPVYAALVSAGRGPQGSETATPKGVYRIWVKLMATNMDNLENEDVEKHYSIEDVPYVQFFAKGVALHGAFWHRSFGTPHSHGCVNLAPVDARWLFDFTAPHLPTGWSAVLPVKAEPGTVVRVR
jgi:lipoprotein-anchoring transpeptidase ErfK/SrfK